MKKEMEYYPSEAQKKKMYAHIMSQVENEKDLWMSLRIWIIEYPWRAAFSVSVIQGITFTLIFGTKYTNFFLSTFRG